MRAHASTQHQTYQTLFSKQKFQGEKLFFPSSLRWLLPLFANKFSQEKTLRYPIDHPPSAFFTSNVIEMEKCETVRRYRMNLSDQSPKLKIIRCMCTASQKSKLINGCELVYASDIHNP